MIAAEIRRLYDGEATFRQFVKKTSSEWKALATYLHRRWPTPEGVTVEDVVQEMLIATWGSIYGADRFKKWDPSRGVALDRYVLWQAMTAAKKWLHAQRAALRHDDRSPSRFALSFASLGSEAERQLLSRVIKEFDELELLRERALSDVLARLSPHAQRIVLDVVESGGNVERAARSLWARSDDCLDLRVGSVTEARSVVRRVVSRALEVAA